MLQSARARRTRVVYQLSHGDAAAAAAAATAARVLVEAEIQRTLTLAAEVSRIRLGVNAGRRARRGLLSADTQSIARGERGFIHIRDAFSTHTHIGNGRSPIRGISSWSRGYTTNAQQQHPVYSSSASSTKKRTPKSSSTTSMGKSTVMRTPQPRNISRKPIPDDNKVLRNPVGVQLLSRPLHAQIFRSTTFPHPPETSIALSQKHLKAHGLKPTDAQDLPNIAFTLPPLEGRDIDAHLYTIAERVAMPSMQLAEAFAKVQVPPRPGEGVWRLRSGWTKYTLKETDPNHPEKDPVDPASWIIEEGIGPEDEDALTFDVETMPKYHRYSVLATAASPTAWYAWISPWLLSETEDSAQLIPLGSKQNERIVVGHNVSYDRARVLEEYDLGKESSVRWVDTLALHVAVKGISSVQRPAWLKWKKQVTKQAQLDAEAEEVVEEDLSGLSPLSEKRLEADRKAELAAATADLEDAAAEVDVDGETKDFERWESITSVNSLLEVAKLHCGITMNKETRNAFMTDTPTQIRAELSKYLDYCATDVETTHAVFSKVHPLFRTACPHPASWSGVMRMGSSFLPVNAEWERYLLRAEGKYRELEGAVKRKLARLAEDAKELMGEEGGAGERWRGDVFLEQLDWTPKVAGKSRGFWVPTKKELKELERNAESDFPTLTLPRWLDELHWDPMSDHARRVLIPLVLHAKWNKHFMFYSSKNGWLYRQSSKNAVPEDDIIVQDLSPDDPAVQFVKEGTVLVRPAELQAHASEPLWSSTLAAKLLKAGVLSTRDDALAKLLTKAKMSKKAVNELLQLAEEVSMATSRKTLVLQQLDWSPVRMHDTPGQPNSSADQKPISVGNHSDGLVPPEGFKYPPPIWPQWYWDLAKPRPDAPPGSIDVTVRNRLAPLLLRLGWLGNPLFHSREHGWCYRVEASPPVSSEDASPAEPALPRTPPLLFQLPEDVLLHVDATQEGYKFFKLPHAQGHEANVGSPLSKSFMKYAQDGTLKSIPKDGDPVFGEVADVSEVLGVPHQDSADHARGALDMNAQCSYWISARDRILNQMVVWEKKKGELGMGKAGEKEDEKWGVILPQVVTMGTVTRRAMEPTWLTASNAKKNRIGSELKAMVRAPPGYAIVGADVDSEELWISSVMGDAQFGMHGATAIGWMTLEGTKKAGTDLHSKTASILGISRDSAKVFNYSRIYGAGMRHAVLLLMQANAGMSTAQATKLAEKLYASTKGKNMHSTQWFGRKFWHGGTESFLFNKLEAIAHSERPMTPALSCGVTSALSKKHLSEEFGSDYLTSRINWVVQSSGVDYLHLLITSMDHLLSKYSINARYMISVHDEVRYLVKEEDKYRAALALQIANLWTRSLFAFRLGLDDLPAGVAFFSAIDVDFILRKEVDMDCVTPSQPIPLSYGESLDIRGVLSKTKNGSLWPDGRPMEIWRSRPKEPAPPQGYVAPDCTVHRAESPEFLNAQSTTQAGEVKMLGKTWAKQLREMGRGAEVNEWMSKQATSSGRRRERARRDAQMLTESFGTPSPEFSFRELQDIIGEE